MKTVESNILSVVSQVSVLNECSFASCQCHWCPLGSLYLNYLIYLWKLWLKNHSDNLLWAVITCGFHWLDQASFDSLLPSGMETTWQVGVRQMKWRKSWLSHRMTRRGRWILCGRLWFLLGLWRWQVQHRREGPADVEGRWWPPGCCSPRQRGESSSRLGRCVTGRWASWAMAMQDIFPAWLQQGVGGRSCNLSCDLGGFWPPEVTLVHGHQLIFIRAQYRSWYRLAFAGLRLPSLNSRVVAVITSWCEEVKKCKSLLLCVLTHVSIFDHWLTTGLVI